jgi:hypothetical protein
MEKTRLHLQKSLVRVHARGTIFPVLNADSVALRYPTKDHSERMINNIAQKSIEPRIKNTCLKSAPTE